MDDLNLLFSSVPCAKTLLHWCAKALKLTGLDFRADKTSSIVIIKRWSMNTKTFSISKPKNCTDVSSCIPSINSRSVKFLGCILDGSISDRYLLDELEKKLISGLGIIDKSFCNGSQKLWILQQPLIPKIQWPLLIYEVLISHTTKNFSIHQEMVTSAYVKIISALLFQSFTMSFPINSFTSVLKSAKISGHLLLPDSQDPLAATCLPQAQNRIMAWRRSCSYNRKWC